MMILSCFSMTTCEWSGFFLCHKVCRPRELGPTLVTTFSIGWASLRPPPACYYWSMVFLSWSRGGLSRETPNRVQTRISFTALLSWNHCRFKLFHEYQLKDNTSGICGWVGRATASVWGDGGSIPTCGALEVLPCDFSPKQFGGIINQLGEP